MPDRDVCAFHAGLTGPSATLLLGHQQVAQDRLEAAQKAEEERVNAIVTVRRQWNDWRQASYRLPDVEGIHWSDLSGGVMATAPRFFLHAYVWCDGMIEGELAHSCEHGDGPHQIKVCIVKKDNAAPVFKMLEAQAGPKPMLKK